MVGVTVLSALVILGWMVVQFGDRIATPFSGKKIAVSLRAPTADGISGGSVLKYRGIPVGTVKDVAFGSDNDVLIRAELDLDKPVPANIRGEIRLPNLLGANAVIDLFLTTPVPSEVKLVGGEVIEAEFVGTGIIPPEVTKLANALSGVVEELRASGVVANFNKLVTDIDDQALKLGTTLDHINEVIGDENVKLDLKKTVAEFRATSERAARVAERFEKLAADLEPLPGEASAVMTDIRSGVSDAREAIGKTDERIEDVSRRINENLDRIALVLADVKSVTAKVDEGKGTAGALVNDPRLYNTLVSATELLAATIKDIQRVAQQIEQEGVKLRLR